MKNYFFIFIGLIALTFLFHSCEEIYTPAIDRMKQLMVVDSHITNDPKQNYVTVFKTRNFYSTSAVEWISGALVELVQDNFKVVKAIEGTPGHYVFPSTPVPGGNYKLRITYMNEVFESDYVIMPPIPSIDSLYTTFAIEKSVRTNGYGVPEVFEKKVRKVSIDIPLTTELKYYRLNYRAVIQWKYTPPPFYDSVPNIIYALNTKKAFLEAATPPPTADDTSIHILYGWISHYNKDFFDLAGPKEFSLSDKILNHHLVSLAYKSQEYLDSATQDSHNWIIILDQYGISKDSYDFHAKLNQQFSAEGSLFDPVLTQVYGNMHCLKDPSRIILGYFDLNSYKQYRYYLNLGTGTESTVVLRQLDKYYEIPDRGYTKDSPPFFWETNYK